ncbi:4'-phosphopantetheinyl transferase family protein [Salipiger thiooxidans]|uniref:4'-phosphopantetheinyl transferase family protein n=1 Tax=Salipiger thiooxidans TaxID=282683 RepID=UPI001CD7F560|nr:4'-phosphopantetheinyl transferase superfamily protein [Salipiger thiooxidans]MCA0846232.1 4'-phosphopantetheinyl transferase superfamily protein [Salipiger thiooxidans]
MTVAALDRALAALDLPTGLGWAVSGPVDDLGTLFPEERAAVARAIPSRRAEFAGGRLAARGAMAALGLPPCAVPAGPDRAPRWPEGVVGSITHDGGLCLAIVGRSDAWQAIGIDLERDADLPPEITAQIATEAELSGLAPLSRGRAAARLFSAKEAAYKAQYPLTRCLFGFDAMTAHLPDGGMRMCADTGLGRGAALPMQQHLVAGRVLSLCLMPRPGVHG